MDRRSFLRTAGLGSVAATAGCLRSALGSGGGETVLDPPEDRQFDSEELPYPAYGQSLPRITLPDPLSGTEIDTAALETVQVVTGFFASCPAECARLISQLAGVQAGTIQGGIAGSVTFLPITFDPKRDNADALKEYATRMNVDIAAGNWHFLRPADADAAERVVKDKLGITFERIGADRSQRLPGYDFRHLSLTFLANPEGIVERTYRTDTPDHERVLSDVKRVVEAT